MSQLLSSSSSRFLSLPQKQWLTHHSYYNASRFFHHPSLLLLSDERFFSSSSDSSNPTTVTTAPRRVDITIDASLGCAHVVLNRPDKLNALDLPMFEAIADAAATLRTERGLRSIILRGNGRAFCTGLDIKSILLRGGGSGGGGFSGNPFVWTTNPLRQQQQRLLQRPSGYQYEGNEKTRNYIPSQQQQQQPQQQPQQQQQPEESSGERIKNEQAEVKWNDDDEWENMSEEEIVLRLQQQQQQQQQSPLPPLPLPAMGNLAQDVAYLWRSVPVPVMAVLHGMCFGGGFQIALGADFRYATPDCQLSMMETKWGLIPDMSASVTLRELMIPMDVVKELIMTGRIVPGTEAATLGLITKCCHDGNPMKHAMDMAQLFSTKSPDALAAAKHLLQSTYYYTGTTAAAAVAPSQQECLQLETQLQQQLLGSWNQIAASARNFGIPLPYRRRNSNIHMTTTTTTTTTPQHDHNEKDEKN